MKGDSLDGCPTLVAGGGADAPPRAADPAEMPLVSIVIPTYDRPEYLRQALASAVAQSYTNLEIIVHDNASPRDPAPVVAGFADPRIALYRNPRNLGVTGNFVAALAKASGKYVAILGDDDLWDGEFVASLVRGLEAHPEAVVAFCDHEVIDEHGQVDPAISDKTTRRFGRHLLSEGVYRPFDEIALVRRSICIVSAAMMRRDAADWWDLPPELYMGDDLYLAYMAVLTGGAAWYCPQRLAQYRYHRQSLTSTLTDIDTRIGNARAALFYWSRFLRDGKLAGNKPYFEMKCGLNALLIVASLVRRGDRKAAWCEFRSFLRQGLIRPRIFFYHAVYALRLHRATA
jgi:glycosyltransferase involved in cell wall biosynthesis